MLAGNTHGIRLEQHHKESLMEPIAELPAPEALVIPMPGCDTAAEYLVKTGDTVGKYQALSKPQYTAPASAALGGLVQELTHLDHPLLGHVSAALVECSPEMRPRKLLPSADAEDPEQVIALAASAGIVDELGGQPLYKKLRRIRRAKVDLVLASAIDDDPYTTSGIAFLREHWEQVERGLQLVQKAIGVPQTGIAVANKKEADRMRMEGVSAPLFASGPKYPARALLKQSLRREGKRVAFLGVQACAGLFCALEDGVPQVETVVTVAGDAVEHPHNLKMPVGTPIGEALRYCGLKDDASLVVVGSSVTGCSVTDLGMPVTANTRCILAFSKVPLQKRTFCIGCGRCAKACMRGILPWSIYKELRNDKIDAMRMTNVQNCIACAACSAVCPAGIDLVDVVLRAAAIKKSGDFD